MNNRTLHLCPQTFAGNESAPRREAGTPGFALVTTVALMVLLVLVALGLLGLSTISLRASSLESARAQARANARMALMLAIGELQLQVGPDTRVTAPADILNSSSASSTEELSVTGVWKSWEGLDHSMLAADRGRPIAPDYASKRESASSSTGRFLTWLVSKPPSVDVSSLISDDPAWSVSTALSGFLQNIPFVDPADSSKVSVPLLSTGSLAAGDTRQVHVMPLQILNSESQRGAYAWWVSGENQKARLPVSYEPADNNDVAGWSKLAKSHAIPDPAALQMDTLLFNENDTAAQKEAKAAKAAKAMTLKTSSLLVPLNPDTPNNPPDPAKQFHDMSAVSVGLLTNTATGGWRKDLSLFTENWDNLPASGVEVFRLTPDAAAAATAKMTRPTVAACGQAVIPGSAFYSQKSVFYPWSTYRVQTGIGPGIPTSDMIGRNITRHGLNQAAVASWHNLMDYATLYKKLTFPNGRPTISSICDGHYYRFTTTYQQGLFDYLHKVRIVPLFGRLQLVYSYRAIPSTTTSGKYKVQIGRTPLATVWNPYNVDLTLLGQWNHFPRTLPPAFRFRIGSHYSENYWSYFGMFGVGVDNAVTNGGRINVVTGDPETWNPIQFTDGTSGSTGVRVPFGVPLAAGETKLYNKDGNPGYDPAFLSTYTRYADIDIDTDAVDAGGNPLPPVKEFDAADQISLTTRFDARCWAASILANVGAHFEMRETRFPALQGDANWPIYGSGNTTYPMDTAAMLWPHMNEIDLPSHPVSAMTGNGVPFLSLNFGQRFSSGSGLPLKGFQQSNPLGLVNFVGQDFEMGIDPQTAGQGARGARNPVNTASDFSYIKHTSWTAVDNLPNCSTDGKNNGYLISGTQSGDGLKRVVVADLPMRPLASLAELQHWDLRKDNPSPPHQFNIIANSDAQPLFAPNAVVRNGTGIPHAAPNPPRIDLQHDDSYCANHILFDDWFFSTIAPQPTTFGPTGKTLQQTFTDFVSTGARLDNRAYRPILEDSGITGAQATSLYATKVNASESYRSIASRLEVEGMFNVNSTSVKAWRALLGHARNQRVPHYDKDGNIDLSDPTSYVASRSTVASDVAAGAGNGTSGDFPEASEYAGYRVFTAEMLDQLAEEMVKQVRLRGPFLSLSEFVNRHLTAPESGDTTQEIEFKKQRALAGAVQSALNVLAKNSSVSDNPYKILQDESQNAGKSVLDAQGKDPLVNGVPTSGYDKFPEASEGERMYGMPGWPRQADILRPLAPILSARDDTFTIRAYGDARDASGKITARATCEAIVRRGRDFVSPTQDDADKITPPTAAANKLFGRRFQLISFRWLNANEI